MSLTRVAVFFLLLHVRCLLAADMGSVCIAPAPASNSGSKSLSNPSGGNQVKMYSVQVDNRPWVQVSAEHGNSITGLLMAGNHIVRVKGDGKNITAFHFRFADYKSADLCLWFKSLYETWSLTESKGHGKNCFCP